VWTTVAHRAQWCFVVVRTDPDGIGHQGLSYLLVPMDQPGIEIRPLRQMTGTAELNEVLFDDARTAKDNVLGEVGDGWKVAMATLGYELYWSNWHRTLGERAMHVLGAGAGLVAGEPGSGYELDSIFLTSRSETISAGSSEISATSSASASSGSRASPADRRCTRRLGRRAPTPRSAC
jgi:alkylation response protein AidB-like acyl-CoA dehydrogenase